MEVLHVGQGKLRELLVADERHDMAVEMLPVLHDCRGFEAIYFGLGEPTRAGVDDGHACARGGMHALLYLVLHLRPPGGHLALGLKRL